MATYGQDAIFGLVFLPDTKYQDELIALSEDLGDLYPSELTLNDQDVLPHVTLIHVATDEPNARAFGARYLADAAEQYLLKPTELYASPWNNAAVGFLEIDNEPWLNDAHLTACVLADEFGLEIVSASRDRFQPHVTLSFWRRANANKLELPQLTAKQPIPATLHLVTIGQHGTATQVLA